MDKGADVEAFGYAGMRALHHACSNSHEGSIGLLLDRGADPNAVDEFGERNMHYIGYLSRAKKQNIIPFSWRWQLWIAPCTALGKDG